MLKLHDETIWKGENPQQKRNDLTGLILSDGECYPQWDESNAIKQKPRGTTFDIVWKQNVINFLLIILKYFTSEFHVGLTVEIDVCLTMSSSRGPLARWSRSISQRAKYILAFSSMLNGSSVQTISNCIIKNSIDQNINAQFSITYKTLAIFFVTSETLSRTITKIVVFVFYNFLDLLIFASVELFGFMNLLNWIQYYQIGRNY